MGNFAPGPILRVDSSDVIPSEEEGFTGSPDGWFDGKSSIHITLNCSLLLTPVLPGYRRALQEADVE